MPTSRSQKSAPNTPRTLEKSQHLQTPSDSPGPFRRSLRIAMKSNSTSDKLATHSISHGKLKLLDLQLETNVPHSTRKRARVLDTQDMSIHRSSETCIRLGLGNTLTSCGDDAVVSTSAKDKEYNFIKLEPGLPKGDIGLLRVNPGLSIGMPKVRGVGNDKEEVTGRSGLRSSANKGKEVLIEHNLKNVFLEIERGAIFSDNEQEKEMEELLGGSISNDDIVNPGELRLIEPINDAVNMDDTEFKEALRKRKYKLQEIMENREKFRKIAIENASKFAEYSPESISQQTEADDSSQVGDDEIPSVEANHEFEDWPGPFSTALKIVRDREANVNMQPGSSAGMANTAPIKWNPKKCSDYQASAPSNPSLRDICINVLAKNAEAITSLEDIPDEIRSKLSHILCDSRKMNSHFLGLLFRGLPTEILVKDCSWVTEEEFTSIFEGSDLSDLRVLKLDLCGRCLPDYILEATLGRSLNNLPALTIISITGACRLSDVGLSSLVHAAPGLQSINLSQCSLLTSASIHTLAEVLGSGLRELYIDDCQITNAIDILPALEKLQNLEVLSLAGIESVCDRFIKKLIPVRGQYIRKLVLSDCVRLTDSSLKVISETCSKLCSIDLVNLSKLTDSALRHLANGCPAIQTIKLCRNPFSDEAVAAFLETHGEFLVELSLNNVRKVSHNTAISLAKHSQKLEILDLSWCRNVSDVAMGLIVDSCSSLKSLKLFGCSQVTDVFLNGHSNRQVKIVGLKMTPLLKDLVL